LCEEWSDVVKNQVMISRALRLAPSYRFWARTAVLAACVASASLVADRNAVAVQAPAPIPTPTQTPIQAIGQAGELPDLIFPTESPYPVGLSTQATQVLAPEQSALTRQLQQLIRYPELPQSMQPTASMWNGLGELPNSFGAPGNPMAAQFDPSFRVSYWSADGGFKNTPDAPWNQGLAARYGWSQAIFDSGSALTYRPGQAELAQGLILPHHEAGALSAPVAGAAL
jgi:hypothetical protein